MSDGLDQSSVILEQQKQALQQQLDTGVAGPAPSSSTGTDVMSEAMLSVLTGGLGEVASIALTAAVGLMSNAPTNNSAPPLEGGIFVNKSGNADALFINKKKGNSARPFVSKKAPTTNLINGANLKARSETTSMSLTGSSMTGGKPSPIKGIKANTATVGSLHLAASLKNKIGAIDQTLQKGYVLGSKRHMDDLKKGIDAAEDAFSDNHQKIDENNTPDFMKLKPPTS